MQVSYGGYGVLPGDREVSGVGDEDYCFFGEVFRNVRSEEVKSRTY